MTPADLQAEQMLLLWRYHEAVWDARRAEGAARHRLRVAAWTGAWTAAAAWGLFPELLVVCAAVLACASAWLLEGVRLVRLADRRLAAVLAEMRATEASPEGTTR